MKTSWHVYVLALACLAIPSCGGGGGGGGVGPGLSSDANLADLTISVGALSPGFSASTTAYDVGPEALPATVEVTATAADSAATLTIAGAAASSGAPSGALALIVGTTPIVIEVTAEDGTTTKSYTISFQRTPPGTADLVALTASAHKLSRSFSPATTAYDVGPAVLPATTTVTVTVATVGATLQVNGTTTASGTPSAALPLAIGDTVVSVTVTAPGGGTSKTYTVTFHRTAPATLSGLTLPVGTLSPTFSTAVTAYDVGPVVLPATATVTATTTDPLATMKVNGTATASGTPSATLSLAIGNTPVAVLVTSADGVTTKTYTVTFHRTAPATLSGMTLSVGTLSPTFSTAVTAYRTDLASTDDSVRVTPTTTDPLASVKVNGVTTTSGSPSFAIPVPMGLTSAVTVTVTSADYVTEVTYAVLVTRPGPESQQAYLKASNTEASDSFGGHVAVSGDTLVVGATGEASNATGVNGTESNNAAPFAGAAYVFVRSGTTWSQQAYLKAANAGTYDGFGGSVAVSGDTIVVGAPGEKSSVTGINGADWDNSAPSAGAAYVFVRSGTTWSQQAYLKASNTETNDEFGWSVAISGDAIVVGAPYEGSNATGVNGTESNNAAPLAGAAYVFIRSGTTWSQQAYLKASNTGAYDLFGSSVAISGDTIVVGVPDEDSNATGVNGTQSNNGASSAGAAYVFVRSGSTWSQQAYLKASNTETDDAFGSSVAISGDTVVVGALGEDSDASGVNSTQSNNGAPSAGAAYVFVRGGTTWSQQAYLKASNTETSDEFGWSVAISGDAIVVGAWYEDSSATGLNGSEADNGSANSGAAYVFHRAGASWTQQGYVKASNAESTDFFGIAVAISGDTIVVGARDEASNATGVGGDQTNNNAADSGAAYVLMRGLTTWAPESYFKASSTGAGDAFGSCVALYGDTLVVGAYHEDSSATGVNGSESSNAATDAGAAYVFTRDGTTWTQQAYLKASNTASADLFGSSVAIAGDTLVIGAPGEDSSATGVNGSQANDGAIDSGAAYVFVRSGGAWTQQAYLKASNTETKDSFGVSVAISGATIVVGASLEDSNATGVGGTQSNNGASSAGATYVFVRNGTSWSQQAYLKASNTEASDQFGSSVAISADTIVVGATQEDSNATGVNGTQSNNSASAAGAAYVFVRSGTTWSQQAYLKGSNAEAGDQFGSSVAISGDAIVVGAPYEDSNATGVNGTGSNNGASNSGAAYAFVRSGTAWTQQAYLKASNTEADDQLGTCVAISGDAIVVGGRQEDGGSTGVNGNGASNSATDAGAAYHFLRSGATWTQQAYLKASNTGTTDKLGNAVAISGDTIVVCAATEDSSATGLNGNGADNGYLDSGAAYTFR